MINSDYDSQIINLANYILDNQTTIRATAKHYGIPKSTVHHYLSVRLKYLNHKLFKDVKELLEQNFRIKHIHGGESTKNKYLKLKNVINKNDEIEAKLL